MGGFFMQAIANNDGSVLMAPDRLISSTTSGFRGVALDHLERLGAQTSVLVIDLSQTLDIDASGLGMLVFIQKRAKERGLSTNLRHAPERVRNLLKLTMLEFLFEFGN
jgi:anti-anti-sigma regulatory factor